MAVALRLTVRFNTVERGRARLSTVEHGRETVEIRYTAVQRGSFNRTLPRSTAARWDLGITFLDIRLDMRKNYRNFTYQNME